MKYEIKALNRIAILNDELVEIYSQYRQLRDNPFVIRVISKYGYEPSVDELSEDDFSQLCNEVLLDELEFVISMPELSKIIEKYSAELKNATAHKRLVNIVLAEEE